MPKLFQLPAILIFVLTCLSSASQNLQKPITNKYLRCYTAERIAAFRKAHPNAETDAQFESWLGQKIKSRNQSGFRPLTNYTIPIVFHVISNGEAVGTSPNIAAVLVQEQILQLNKDFANVSNSPYSVAANTGIQFVLAQNGPANNVLAEPGIDRINRNNKGWTDYTANAWDISYVDATVKPASVWDANSYFNVWIIPAFTNGSTSDILGYSTFPASSSLDGLNNDETSSTAGVVVLTRTVGSTYSPGSCGNGFGMGKTFTHETGHFLGLRHIWGDADCATDYCDDTPVQFGPNFGVPTHPKSNSCGTADEMFEDYMDYSDDIVLNTFTVDQVARMQTVMLNSPRRLSLTTSGAGAVTVTGSNKISFINCTGSLAVMETGINTTYPRTRDVSLTLNTEDKATGDATVTIVALGTAVSGVDYQLLTPTVVFAAGDNFKPVNLRIFDNARVDGLRTINLSYTISGNGVAAGANTQSVAVSLFDDDSVRIGQNPIKLLDEHFETLSSTTGLPAGWNLLSTSNYVNLFVAASNGNAGGSGNCAFITNNTNTKPDVYTKGVKGAAVLQSPVIDASTVAALGDLTFTYRTFGLVDNDDAVLTYNTSIANLGPFLFYGSNDGALGYGPYSNNTAAITNAPDIPAPPELANQQFNLSFYWETGTLTTGHNPGFNVDDIVLAATPFPVETAVSSSYTFDIRSGAATSNFKSTNNKIIASVNNLSATVSAVTVQVTQAGTGNVTFNTTGGSFLRSQKVFQISPSFNNSTATYQASFYFTAAELAVWGANRLNLKILKVKDGVSLSETLDFTDAEIITPTVVEDTADGYIAYTGSFTGFSQFVLVSPLATLPVSFISFQATPLQKNIQLVWSTAEEINNKQFLVERSIDGASFARIATVAGEGTTSVTSSYTYIDNYVQPGVTYYYRIIQVDIDNRQSYSVIQSARINPGAGISIAVSPNPANTFVNLFINGTTNKATLELMNSIGQKLLRQSEVNAVDNIYKLPLNGLPKGVYTIVVYLPEGVFAKKIIVQ